jgi:hypothetical protein
MYACKPTQLVNLQVAAMAPRADVLFNVGDRRAATHEANGVAWYFDASTSIGFAPAGAVVDRFTCDTAGPEEPTRSCWHTSGGDLTGGWRCGANRDLFDGTYHRRGYTSTGP